MARLRGHARRKKTRLTDRTFDAVMDIGRDAAAVADAAAEGESAEGSLDAVELNIIELLRGDADVVAMPAAYNEATSVFTGASDFPTERYMLGLMVCPQCHSEMV